MNPMVPSHTVLRIMSWVYTLVKSANSRVGMRMAPRMMSPPMVGVPCLFIWPSSPKSRTISPTCFSWSRSMIRLPNRMPTKRLVSKLIPARKDTKLNRPKPGRS